MTREERTAFVRVLVDLIKADSIIDKGEMELYAELRQRFGIKGIDEADASTMPLADAVMVLAGSSEALRCQIMDVFSDMTVSDGFCAKQEAQLMLALMCCLGTEYNELSEMYSVHEPDVLIEDNQVMYVETKYDEKVNEDIKQNYRSIDKELRLAGFNFVYIPHITEHYRSTDNKLFEEIAHFLAPEIVGDALPLLIDRLKNITTEKYCVDQLCNKLGMTNLRDHYPSLLIKVSNTHVGEKLYTNFLRIEIEDKVLPLVRSLIDTYCGMLSSDTRSVSGSEEASGQFMYHGFYKQLFDIYIISKGVRSKLLIDFDDNKLLLPDLNCEITGMNRRDKALYVLLLMETKRHGIDFSKSRKRLESIQEKYKVLYYYFGGKENAAPQLSDSKIRGPIISHIRRCINRLRDKLHNVDDYTVCRNSMGNYCVNLSHELVFVNESNNLNKTSNIRNSKIFKKIEDKNRELQYCRN